MLLVTETWLVDGIAPPLDVSGGSMAETILGPHRVIVCRDCGRRFRCDTRDAHPGRPATCPNCGFGRNPAADARELPGDRILMDRATWRVFPPTRWEVAAFRDPRAPGRIAVKRIVGLPGESVEIRRGDVFIDGRIQRKPLARQRAMAVLVHDADHPSRAPDAPESRWRPEPADVPWGSAGGRFAHPARPDAKRVDWLVYHHAIRLGDCFSAGPVTDDDTYNLARPRRAEEVSTVTDLLLGFEVRRHYGRGRLLVRATDGGEVFEVGIDPGRERFEVLRGGRPIPVAEGSLPGLGPTFLVEVSLFDAALTLAIDGREVASVAYEPNPKRRPDDRPWALGAKELGVELGSVRVYRDVYYTHPLGPLARWAVDRPVALGPDEFFVLGDNSPISEDSRTWPDGPGLDAKFLIGKPLAVHIPSDEARLGPWHIRVPAVGRIRYIR
ncbi:MAG: hypothetical protein JW809_00360 [Pirellulales bacterium]|nr:hypothetical protein [Pirellulales bacterium]